MQVHLRITTKLFPYQRKQTLRYAHQCDQGSGKEEIMISIRTLIRFFYVHNWFTFYMGFPIGLAVFHDGLIWSHPRGWPPVDWWNSFSSIKASSHGNHSAHEYRWAPGGSRADRRVIMWFPANTPPPCAQLFHVLSPYITWHRYRSTTSG